MKINILINNKYYKIYNILKIINNITPLRNGVNKIIGFDDSNPTTTFLKQAKELQTKRCDKVIVFDQDGFYPFMLFAKQDGICPAYPLHEQIASLTTQHNNANVLIIAKQFIGENNIEKYITNHLNSKFEAGRHEIRTNLMLKPWSKASKEIEFNKNSDTILICSDHAGYNLKQKVIQHLQNKKYKILDIGCYSNNSTHYPLWAIAFGLSVTKAYTGICICSSGVGISVTTNKFKGLRCCVCHNPEAALIAKKEYNANVIGLGGNFVDADVACKTIDTFLKQKSNANKLSKTIDKYGFKFSKTKFAKIDFDRSIDLPELLK